MNVFVCKIASSNMKNIIRLLVMCELWTFSNNKDYIYCHACITYDLYHLEVIFNANKQYVLLVFFSIYQYWTVGSIKQTQKAALVEINLFKLVHNSQKAVLVDKYTLIIENISNFSIKIVYFGVSESLWKNTLNTVV